MPPEGIIAFQLHQGKPMEAVFRNIQFVDLSETPTPMPPTPVTPIAGTPTAPCQGVIYTDGPCDYWYCPPRRLFGRLRCRQRQPDRFTFIAARIVTGRAVASFSREPGGTA